jgi:hypothetical protein
MQGVSQAEKLQNPGIVKNEGDSVSRKYVRLQVSDYILVVCLPYMSFPYALPYGFPERVTMVILCCLGD